jgi:hypothetical protein
MMEDMVNSWMLDLNSSKEGLKKGLEVFTP